MLRQDRNRAQFPLFIAAAVLLMASAVGVQAAATYTWDQSTSTDYQVATNWTPDRNTPAIDDILTIDGAVVAGNERLTNVATETIGQLHLTNGAQASLEASTSAKTITIAGDTGTDFTVAAGCMLRLGGTIGVTIVLPTSTGQVDGDVLFNATAASVVHRIVAQTAGALVFTNGSTAAMAPTGSGALGGFGSTAAPAAVDGGVIFQSGATYYQGGTKDGVFNGGTGSNPFSLAQPATAVVFQSGSTYRNITGIPASVGRTYGNFVYSNSAVQTVGGTTATMTVLNDFIITSNPLLAQANLNLSQSFSGGPALVIGGDLIVETGSGGLTVTAAPAAATSFQIAGNIDIQNNALFTPGTNANLTWLLNGSAVQDVDLDGDSLQNLNVSNASGVTLSGNAGVNGTLTLTAGEVATGANVLTLGNAATVVRTAGNINGPVTRTIDATVTGARVIPCGTAGVYSPVTFDITGAGTGTGSLVAAPTAADHPNSPNPAITINRHWALTPTGISGFTATLIFGYDDADLGAVPEADLWAHRYTGSGTTWERALNTSVDTGLNTVTATGVTTLSDWTLGTGAVPVELSVFSAY